MKNKFFYTLTMHILLDAICYLIFKLTWMGPEAGIIFQYFPIDVRIIFILSAVIQVMVILAYWHVGKNICTLSLYSLFIIGSICIINVISVIVIYCFFREIQVALKIFAIYGGAPFFLISVISGFNSISNMLTIITPSIIMFVGNMYGFLKSNK